MIVERDGLVFRTGRQTPLGGRPVAWTLRHPLAERLFWPLLWTGWLTVAGLLAAEMWGEGERWSLALPALFALIGIGMLLASVSTLVWSRRETIGRDAVEVVERDGAGRRAWTEPLAGYRGVAIAEVPPRAGRHRLAPMRVVLLDHDEPARRVVLWHHMMPRGIAERRDAYAAWLGLPPVGAAPSAGGTIDETMGTVRRA